MRRANSRTRADPRKAEETAEAEGRPPRAPGRNSARSSDPVQGRRNTVPATCVGGHREAV